MPSFMYAKPTPISWNYAVTIDELARETPCHFCNSPIVTGDKVLVSSDFNGTTLIHTEHFERVDNGTP